MQNINQYNIHCANWEFTIDSDNPKSAAIESIIMAFGKYKKNLNLSTTIMVDKISNKSSSVKKRFFFGTHEILKEIGMKGMSETLKIISNLPKDEIANLK